MYIFGYRLVGFFLILVQDVHTKFGKYIAVNKTNKVYDLWNIKTFPV